MEAIERQAPTGKEEYRVLKAVVFDMDETLLDINLSAFIAIYARDYANLLARIGRGNPLSAAARLGGALFDLNANRRAGTDNRTNGAFFREAIERRCGVKLDDSIVADAFTYYEREILPQRNDGIIDAHPREGSLEALDVVFAHGLRCALLTNPSFTKTCIECRMGWGGLTDVPFERVTHMDNSTRCKPDPTYYLENLQIMGLEPHEVLMVGNDPRRDFPTPDCGIQTAYVGRGKPARALWSGTMLEFAQNFDRIEELFEQTVRPIG